MKYLSVWFAIPEKRQKIYLFKKITKRKLRKINPFLISDSDSADQKS